MQQKETLIVKQLEAVSLSIQPEGRVFLNSKMLPEIVGWHNGEHYVLGRVDIIQKESRQLEDGTHEAEFDIKIVEAKGSDHNSEHGR